MATKVEGLIQKVNPGDNVKYSIASTAYGYCQTAAATAAKVVDMTGFTLLEGTTIHVKFQYANTAANPTLNVNGTGAKNIVLYGTEKAGTAAETSGWQAGAVVSLTYDGTSWVRDQGYNTNATSDNTKVAKTGDTMSGSLTMSKNGEIGVEVENTAQTHKVAYIVGSSGNGGIYDRTHSKWVVYSTTAGQVELNGHAGSATYAASALNATHSSSAGYAASAARATYAMSAASAGYAASAAQATHATSANYAVNATNATEAVHAATAGYASSAGYASAANSANTSGTSSWAVTAGNAKTALTASQAVHAASAGYATKANSASHAIHAGSAGYAASANSANISGTASWAITANNAVSAGKWTTAKTLTIGDKGQSVDGSSNITWTMKDMHVAPQFNVGDTTTATYVLVTLNQKISWMYNFTLKVYSSYTATDFQISGYNYGTNHWYSPQARIIASTSTANRPVYFGYTADWELWVAVDGGNYTGASVVNLVNGHSQADFENAVTVTKVSALPGTLQTTVNCYRPWYRDETIPSASSAGYAASAAQATHAASAGYAVSASQATHAASAGYAANAGTATDNTKLPLAGGQMTGNITWKDSTALPQFSGAPAYLLGIEAFANGGATKWQNVNSISVANASSATYAIKAASAGYAASAARATYTASAGYAEFVGKGSHNAVVAANEFTPPVGSLTIVGNVNNTSMSHTNNANAEMIIKTHPTSGTNYYEARLGFSGNGSLYYMPVNTTTWKTIAYTTSDITGKSGSAGYAASAAQATHAASAGYAVSASQATHSASAGYSTSAAQATHSASAGYASSAARATYAAKAALTTTTGAVAFYSDAAGTFANDADFLWDATNNKLTAAKLNGYVMAGQKSGTTLGSKATAEGNINTASGYYSHVEGFNNVVSGTASHAEGYFNNVSGLYAHAEGSQTTASAAYVHTEGYQTIASAQYAHAEGQNTTASGQQSHSEGYKTKASGQYSHTEGFQTVASGQASHAMGYDTIASGNYQTVFGKYNLPGSLYAEIVGIGSTSAARANGRTLDWYGNEILSGGLTTPKLIGSGETLYGETLPETGTEGQVFFQLSDGYVYEIPAGGTANDILVKNSATDRDVVWTRDYVKRSGDTMTGTLTILGTAASQPLIVRGIVGCDGSTGAVGPLYLNSEKQGNIYLGNSGTGVWVDSANAKLWGAVWNDYAECRITKEDIEPGRCIKEIGDDTLELTTERLMRGCEIVSDTFGFAIGQSEIAKTPTAASGRVLAYLYEDREEAKQKIGWPVCSGPNGTVSIMTEEEEEKYPSRIIGTISAVPDYDIWYGGADNDNPIQVNGRIWIRIR